LEVFSFSGFVSVFFPFSSGYQRVGEFQHSKESTSIAIVRS
jgi:hypothetical protein